MGIIQVRRNGQFNPGAGAAASSFDVSLVQPLPGELVMFGGTAVTGSANPDLSCSGWTKVTQQDVTGAGNFPVVMFYKQWQPSDGLIATVIQATGNCLYAGGIYLFRAPTLGMKCSIGTVAGSAEGSDLTADYAACTGYTVDDLEFALGGYRGTAGAYPTFPALTDWTVQSSVGTGGSFSTNGALWKTAGTTSPGAFTHTHNNSGEHTLMHFVVTEVTDTDYYTTGQGQLALGNDVLSTKSHNVGSFADAKENANPTKVGRGRVKRLGYIDATNNQPFIVKQLSAGGASIARSWKNAIKRSFGGGTKIQ